MRGDSQVVLGGIPQLNPPTPVLVPHLSLHLLLCPALHVGTCAKKQGGDMLQVALGVVGLLQGVILHKFYSQEPIWVVEPSRKAFSFSMHGPHGGLLQLHHTALQWVTTALLQLHHSSLCWQVNSHSPPPRSGLLNTLNTIITHGKLPCADTYYFPYHSYFRTAKLWVPALHTSCVSTLIAAIYPTSLCPQHTWSQDFSSRHQAAWFHSAGSAAN